MQNQVEEAEGQGGETSSSSTSTGQNGVASTSPSARATY